MTTIQVPEGYEYVLFTALIMSIECLFVGFLVAGKARMKIFNKEYLKDNFGPEHEKTFGQEIKPGGAPDMGSGYYASKLSYKDWYLFNNAQRAHLNFVEMIASSLMFLLVGGLYCPCIASGLGGLMIISRILYATGYANKGPNGRLIGAVLNDVALLGLFIMGMIFVVKLMMKNSGCGK